MKIYQIAGGLLGGTYEIGDDDPSPSGWTRTIPPEVPEGQQAVWNGSGAWILQPIPEPTSPPIFVPGKVSRFQALAALHNVGLLDDATAAVNAAGGLAKLAWDNATEFERSSPTIASLAGALGLSFEQIDRLFIEAAKIKA